VENGRLRRIAVAFGSNLGDRRAAILAAAAEVGRILTDFVLSPIIETAPVGPGQQHAPSYLNAVGVGLSSASSRELLHELMVIEQQAGRTRPYPGAPRVIDLDLILAGEDVVDEPDLQVPHPRFRERRFVLEPLTTTAADMHDPVTGLTVAELLQRLAR
jgi:2-amino-4-hydroxy-6-hydroxymethyldihydropteridine diphosphokinase